VCGVWCLFVLLMFCIETLYADLAATYVFQVRPIIRFNHVRSFLSIITCLALPLLPNSHSLFLCSSPYQVRSITLASVIYPLPFLL
jgi:hypothetical protein